MPLDASADGQAAENSGSPLDRDALTPEYTFGRIRASTLCDLFRSHARAVVCHPVRPDGVPVAVNGGDHPER